MTLRRFIPANRRAILVSAVLIALVLVLGGYALSLATWGAPGWASPRRLHGIGLAQQVLSDVVMNPAGYGFIAWIEGGYNDGRVYVSRFLPDTGWTAGVPVDDGGRNPGATKAKLAVSERGDALAVWIEESTPSYLRANRFISGQGWTSVVFIDVQVDGRIEDFAMAMDSKGDGIVLWSQHEIDPVSGNQTGRLYSARFSSGAAWEAPSVVGTGWVSDVILLENGTAVAAWATTGGSLQMVGHQTPGGSWSAPVTLNAGLHGHGRPSLCAARGDGLFAVWQEWKENAFSLWYSEYIPARGWGAPQAIPGGSDATFGGLACTGRGDLILMSITSPLGERNLAAIRWNVTTGWSTPFPIGTPQASGAQWPTVRANAAGDVIVAWWQQGSRDEAFASRFTIDSTFAQALRLDSEGGVGPRVGIDSQGNAIVAWNRGSGSGTGVWVNRFIVPNSGVLRIPIVDLSIVLVAAVGTGSTALWWWGRALRAWPRAP